MEGRRRVLSRENGGPAAKVMFVAEAPGRNGADRTGIPLFGDPTGANFENLLREVNWSRNEVFVTNAVLCNPRDSQDRNDRPTDRELVNCSFNLDQTIQIIDPLVIVTLGGAALQALSFIQKHSFKLAKVIAQEQRWNGRILFPLYHPSPRVMNSVRSYSKQKGDFLQLAMIVRFAENPNASY
jgi:DNA polymerase